MIVFFVLASLGGGGGGVGHTILNLENT